MKQIIAVACIVLLCVGLLIYSFADQKSPGEPVAVPVVATPDEPEFTQATEPTSEPTTDPEALPEATPDEPQQPPREETVRLTFYNDQPVLQLVFDLLAEEFFQQTGIRVVTVSSEPNLNGEAPVLFSVGNTAPKWPCLDLSDSVAYANLACDCFTLKDGEKVLGIANEVEPFGIMYNTALLARVGYTGVDIQRFADLKAVSTYITQNTETLGFSAFAKVNQSLLDAIPRNPQQLLELYEANSAEGEFLKNSAVFCFGTLTDMEWFSAGGQLQLEMMPLYSGETDEASQGVHCFVKHYWCVREDATPEEIQGALAFLSFLVTPRMDGTVPVDDLCLLAPYRQSIYARNSVQQRFRDDVAQGKECIVCEPY